MIESHDPLSWQQTWQNGQLDHSHRQQDFTKNRWKWRLLKQLQSGHEYGFRSPPSFFQRERITWWGEQKPANRSCWAFCTALVLLNLDRPWPEVDQFITHFIAIFNILLCSQISTCYCPVVNKTYLLTFDVYWTITAVVGFFLKILPTNTKSIFCHTFSINFHCEKTITSCLYLLKSCSCSLLAILRDYIFSVCRQTSWWSALCCRLMFCSKTLFIPSSFGGTKSACFERLQCIFSWNVCVGWKDLDDPVSSYLFPVYTAEKRVSLDICEARLDLATQPLLGILLGPRQRVREES